VAESTDGGGAGESVGVRVDFRVRPSQYWFNKWLMPDAKATDLKDGSFVLRRDGS
jgi:hypothetical protein